MWLSRFPRSAEDIHLCPTPDKMMPVVKVASLLKMERAEAVEVMDEIILRRRDAVMVARGDLGVEIGDAALPPIQKKDHFSEHDELNTCGDHRDADDGVDD